MSKRYKTVAVTASGSGETLSDALAGLGEKKRNVIGLQYTNDGVTTGGLPTRSTNVRAYKNQDQVVDYNIGHFDAVVFSNTSMIENVDLIPLDMKLDRGDGFQVGLYNASLTPTGDIVMVYEDME